MPESDERRRAAVEKAAIALHRVFHRDDTQNVADARWHDHKEILKDVYRKEAEAALDSVGYFPLAEVAEAVVRGFGDYQLMPGDEKLGYGPYLSPLASMVRTELIIGLKAALDRLAKSEEAAIR